MGPSQRHHSDSIRSNACLSDPEAAQASPHPWHQGLPGAAPLWASAGRWSGPLLALGEERPVRRVWVEFQVPWLSFSPALHACLPET